MQTFPEHLLCASILSSHWRQNSEADGQKLLYWGVRGHGAGFLPSGQNKGVFLGEGQNLRVCTCFVMAGSAFSPQALVDAGEGDPQLHFHLCTDYLPIATDFLSYKQTNAHVSCKHQHDAGLVLHGGRSHRPHAPRASPESGAGASRLPTTLLSPSHLLPAAPTPAVPQQDQPTESPT